MTYSPSGGLGIVSGFCRIDNLDVLVRSIGYVKDLNGNVLAFVLELLLVLREVLGALKVKGALANADLVARTAAGLLERVVNTHARKLVLQVDDGLLVFPVGLDNHALDGATDHAKGMGLFLNNTETLLTLQATALPLIVAQIDRLIGDSQLGAQLSHLLAHGKHQCVEAGRPSRQTRQRTYVHRQARRV